MKARFFEALLSTGVLVLLGTVLWATNSTGGPSLFARWSSNTPPEYAERSEYFSGVYADLSDVRGLPSYIEFEDSLECIRRARIKLLQQASADSSMEELAFAATSYRDQVASTRRSFERLRSIVTSRQWDQIVDELDGAVDSHFGAVLADELRIDKETN